MAHIELTSASVIVPAYNVESRLRRCVDSVLAQTVRPAEVVVINDGSSDRMAEVAELGSYSPPSWGLL